MHKILMHKIFFQRNTAHKAQLLDLEQLVRHEVIFVAANFRVDIIGLLASS